MKTQRIPTLTIATAALILAACDVDQTEEGSLPDIDVEGGNLPEYDVDMADVDVGTTEETVTVPKLKVVMEEETVEVPFIDVDMPDDDRERSRQTIQVSTRVASAEADLEIDEVYQLDDELMVVSRLTGPVTGGDKRMVSDQIVVNAPELEVSHVIIGQEPAVASNDEYRFVASASELEADLADAKRIYSRD